MRVLEARPALPQAMVEAGAKPIHETTPDELWAQVGALADMFGTAGCP